MQKLFHGLWEDICFFKLLIVSYFEALSETNQMKRHSVTLGSAIKFWLSIGCFTQEYMENITVALRFF